MEHNNNQHQEFPVLVNNEPKERKNTPLDVMPSLIVTCVCDETNSLCQKPTRRFTETDEMCSLLVEMGL